MARKKTAFRTFGKSHHTGFINLGSKAQVKNTLCRNHCLGLTLSVTKPENIPYALYLALLTLCCVICLFVSVFVYVL